MCIHTSVLHYCSNWCGESDGCYWLDVLYENTRLCNGCPFCQWQAHWPPPFFSFSCSASLSTSCHLIGTNLIFILNGMKLASEYQVFSGPRPYFEEILEHFSFFFILACRIICSFRKLKPKCASASLSVIWSPPFASISHKHFWCCQRYQCFRI